MPKYMIEYISTMHTTYEYEGEFESVEDAQEYANEHGGGDGWSVTYEDGSYDVDVYPIEEDTSHA